MKISLNGEPHELAGPLSLNALLAQLNIDPRRVAVEHNLTVVKRANYDSTQIREGDQVEIVNFVGGGQVNSDPLVIAGREFVSRLIVGTGKYSSFQVMQRAHEASGADMVTVAVRRVNISDRTKESLLDYIDTGKIALLPNTAGCYSADDAVRTARLGREAGLSNWVKLEVIGDQETLLPDTDALLEATVYTLPPVIAMVCAANSVWPISNANNTMLARPTMRCAVTFILASSRRLRHKAKFKIRAPTL